MYSSKKRKYNKVTTTAQVKNKRLLLKNKKDMASLKRKNQRFKNRKSSFEICFFILSAMVFITERRENAMKKETYTKSSFAFDSIKLQRNDDSGCGNQGACNGK